MLMLEVSPDTLCLKSQILPFYQTPVMYNPEVFVSTTHEREREGTPYYYIHPRMSCNLVLAQSFPIDLSQHHGPSKMPSAF